MLNDGGKKRDKHEYDFDSSDEEDIRNTVGNVPMHWYDSLPHVGYDSTGRPIMRPGTTSQGSDAISKFLQGTATEDGEQASEWRTVLDPKTGQSVILSDRDLEIVTKMSAGKGVFGDFEDDLHQPWDDFFSKDVLLMPVTAHPPQKRSFIPSLLDKRRVGRITHAIKMGWIQPRLPAWALDDVDDQDKLRRYSMYMSSGNPSAFDEDEGDILGFSPSALSICVFPDVWADQNDTEKSEDSFAWQAGLPASLQTYKPPRPRPFMRPAAEPLPSHAESYNPPPEFLLSEEEERLVMRAWRDKMKDNQVSKVFPIMPRKFDCLRHVPFSQRYLREREERVKDMIMATRVEKQQVHTTPEALLPEIPSLSELRPYPSHLGLEYKSHGGRVTALSVSPCGQWLASVSPVDCCLRIWETSTNFCFRCYQLETSTSVVAEMRRSVAGGLLKTARRIDDDQNDDYEEDDEDEIAKLPSAYVTWNPNAELCLVAAAIGQHVYIINPVLGDRVNTEKTDVFLRNCWKNHLAVEEAATSDELEPKRAKIEEAAAVEVGEGEGPEEETSKQVLTTWSFQAGDEKIGPMMHSSLHTYETSWNSKPKKISVAQAMARSKTLEMSRVSIQLHQPIVDLSWHPKGDYLLTLSMSILSHESRSRSSSRLLIHRISRMTSQAPFTATSTEEWRTAAFNPSGKPQLTVAGPKHVQIFDLVAQKELRRLKLDLPSDILRCTFLHPSGEHIVAGTSDSRFVWFDVELGNVPYKKMRLNHGTVHKVHIHSCRPLVSVALDDGSLFILHCKVSDDLMSKPLIVPVQLIRTGCRRVFSTVFHNRLPHVYAGGEDGTIRQFVAWN